jgi:hypothetical protein
MIAGSQQNSGNRAIKTLASTPDAGLSMISAAAARIAAGRS